MTAMTAIIARSTIATSLLLMVMMMMVMMIFYCCYCYRFQAALRTNMRDWIVTNTIA